MPLSPSAYFRNAPGRSRLARTSSFRIFATDFRPPIQSHSLHFRAHAITFYPSCNLDDQSWRDRKHWDLSSELKQNT
jgi:hypothetical protein